MLNIGFLENAAVHKNLLAIASDHISSHRDDALDKEDVLPPKDNDVLVTGWLAVKVTCVDDNTVPSEDSLLHRS